jgi:hypothetical protein
MDMVLGLLALPLLPAVPLAYVWLQVRLLQRWTGAWRMAVLVPPIGWMIWATGFVRDVSVDPTSHNLFPLEILLGVLLASLYLGSLTLARRLTRRLA